MGQKFHIANNLKEIAIIVVPEFKKLLTNILDLHQIELSHRPHAIYAFIPIQALRAT
jgi:hypothetical protein